MISIFNKDHPERATAMSPPQNSTLSMARPIVEVIAKEKRNRGRHAKFTKQVKKASKEVYGCETMFLKYIFKNITIETLVYVQKRTADNCYIFKKIAETAIHVHKNH